MLRLTLWALGLGVGTALAGCASSPPAISTGPTSPSAPTPSASASPGATTGCLSEAQAQAVWTTVNDRLDAIELDPTQGSAGQVATGDALTLIGQYLQQRLEANRLHEKEVDRLDSLSVVQAACNGEPLVIDVSVTIVSDDYLRPDGTVDHADPAVGTTLELRETLVLSGGAWKEADFVPETGAQQSPLAL